MAAFFDNGSMERGMVMQTYRGKSVFGGVAVGKICVYQKGEQTVKRTKIENTEQEKARFNAAVQESIRQLGELYEKAVKEVGEANAAIFEIHQIMLEDEDYLDAVQNIIDTQKVNAEYAVAVTGDNFAQMFAATNICVGARRMSKIFRSGLCAFCPEAQVRASIRTSR